jgi:hypothetical protein
LGGEPGEAAPEGPRRALDPEAGTAQAQARRHAAALAGTSVYLLKAQRLLARPGDRVLREQRVVSNVGAVLAVVIGMAVTYLVVFLVAWAAGSALFGDRLLGGWVGPGLDGDAWPRAQMAAFTAALSLAIGALGASFEPHGYFRHVTLIDEEI